MATLLKDLGQFISRYWRQEFYFLAITAYMMFEYVRPQDIYPALNFLPWAQTALLLTVAGFIVSRKPLRFHVSDFLLLAFFGVIAASAYTSTYPEYSVERLSAYYSWIVVVWCFHNAVNSREKLFLITVFFFLACFKIALHGALTWAGRGFAFTDWGISGPPGFFNNSGELSLLMVMVIGLSLCFLRAFTPQMSKMRKFAYYLLPVTAAMTVLAASSRGGQLAMIAVLIAYYLIFNKPSMRRIFAVGALLALIYLALPQEQRARFEAIGEDSTSQSRLAYWSAAWDMMNDHKLLGIGHYAFPQYFQEYYRPFLPAENGALDRLEVAHNTYLDIGATLGYTGLIVYLAIIWYCFRLTRKARAALRDRGEENTWLYMFTKGLDLSMLGFLVGSVFMSVAFYPFIYLQLMISQSAFNIASGLAFSRKRKRAKVFETAGSVNAGFSRSVAE